MKRQIVAMFLVGGLVLGLCGCGGSSSSSAAPAPPAEVGSASATTVDEVAPEEPNGSNVEEYSTEDLGLDAEQSETDSENGDIASNIDTSSLLTTHVIEFKDADGYDIRETIQLSPIFREDDMETVYALWEALGNDAVSFPSEESLYNASYLLREMRDTWNCNDLEYVIGTYTVENLTDGFPITSDNPRTYNGTLRTNQVSAFDEEHDGNASDFFNVRSVSVVMYTNGATYYGERQATVISEVKMCADVWGPCVFVIALPNGSTPNQPDGYRYDKILLRSSGTYLCQDYDTITLKYFE